jgi:hypothetical protein
VPVVEVAQVDQPELVALVVEVDMLPQRFLWRPAKHSTSTLVAVEVAAATFQTPVAAVEVVAIQVFIEALLRSSLLRVVVEVVALVLLRRVAPVVPVVERPVSRVAQSMQITAQVVELVLRLLVVRVARVETTPVPPARH